MHNSLDVYIPSSDLSNMLNNWSHPNHAKTNQFHQSHIDICRLTDSKPVNFINSRVITEWHEMSGSITAKMKSQLKWRYWFILIAKKDEEEEDDEDEDNMMNILSLAYTFNDQLAATHFVVSFNSFVIVSTIRAIKNQPEKVYMMVASMSCHYFLFNEQTSKTKKYTIVPQKCLWLQKKMKNKKRKIWIYMRKSLFRSQAKRQFHIVHTNTTNYPNRNEKKNENWLKQRLISLQHCSEYSSLIKIHSHVLLNNKKLYIFFVFFFSRALTVTPPENMQKDSKSRKQTEKTETGWRFRQWHFAFVLRNNNETHILTHTCLESSTNISK